MYLFYSSNFQSGSKITNDEHLSPKPNLSEGLCYLWNTMKNLLLKGSEPLKVAYLRCDHIPNGLPCRIRTEIHVACLLAVSFIIHVGSSF